MSYNRVVHFEIPANEPGPLTEFYAQVFGWKFEKAPLPGPEYWLATTGADAGSPGINGAVMQRQHPSQPWMNYVEVESIDATVAKAMSIGAKVALPRTPMGPVGAIAALIDPQGNIVGLWEKTKA